MGSKTFDGVWFLAYSDDHTPPHVHGRTDRVEVIIDLLPNNQIRQSLRRDAIRPASARRRDVRHVLSVAAEHAAELHELWEKTHGTPSE